MKINHIFHKKVLFNKSGFGEIASGSCFRKKIHHFKYVEVFDRRKTMLARPNSINDSIRELDAKGKHITELELGYVKTRSDDQLFYRLKKVIVK